MAEAETNAEPEMMARNYQSQIEEVALKENSIIFLPTGTGKTFIAIQLMKRLQHLTHPPFSQGGKRTFFLVNTVPLVSQHVKAIKNLSSLTVKGLTSQDKVDLWNLNMWNAEMENIQVFVMTSQILCDMLLHSYIQLDRINLLIFDECHAAVNDHPMRQIMRQFESISLEDAPRVIGLTATILNGNVKLPDVAATVRELELTFHATICTCDAVDEVLQYSTKPSEKIISFEEYVKNTIDMYVCEIFTMQCQILDSVKLNEDMSAETINPDFQQILVNKNKSRTKIKKLIKCLPRILDEFGTYGCSLAVLCTMIKIERLKLKADVETQAIFQYLITSCTKARAILENYIGRSDPYQNLLQNSSSKLKSLLRFLKEYSPKALADPAPKLVNKHNEAMCCIIFVKERITALVLSLFLKHVKQYNKDFEFLNHDFITGFNTNPFSDTREDLYEKKQNKLVVHKYRLGLLNCLISTDILEEGFDLPQCNLIIRFDELMSFKSYIQSKGRGRQSTASYVILVPKTKIDVFQKSITTYQSVFDTVNKMLIGKTHSREAPTSTELSNVYKNTCEPYIFNNARITVNSSIGLLSRYCSTLDHDIYTDPQPTWYHMSKEKKVVWIKMPTNSPLKEVIMSPPMSTIKEAKQVAAMMACRRLHEIGELNKNLLPRDRVHDIFTDACLETLFSHCPTNEIISDKSISLKTSKQTLYPREYPKCFKRTNNDIPDTTFYVHYLGIIPKRESENGQLTEIYKILESDSGYALITKNKLHKICQFSLFLSSGEVTMDVSNINIPVTLPNELFEKIKRFHVMLFFDVLDIKQSFLALDNYSDDNYYFVAPTCKNIYGSTVIDEGTLDKYAEIDKCTEPSVNFRRELVVKAEDYLHHIVAPWYRADNTQRYIVTEVCDAMTPDSPFCNPEYESFADYFYTKYNLRVLGQQNQRMLRVRPIGGKMNCLLPRSITYANGENISKRKLKSIYEESSIDMHTYDEVFVPEFCFKYDFPGVLWLKGILLPSALHRIIMLLQAEELRQKISIESGLGCVNLEDGLEWEPLSVDLRLNKITQNNFKIINKEYSPDSSPETSHAEDSTIGNKNNDISFSFQLSKESIDAEFPWSPEIEPVDINRNIDSVKLIDIECFDKFASQILNSKDLLMSPVKQPKLFSSRAICAPPHKYNDVIHILKKKITKIGPQLSAVLETLTIARSNDVINLERLETLGDSFLKFASSIYLWHKYPQFSEGELTTVKGKLVSNKNLYYCGQQINLAGRMKTAQFNSKNNWLLPAFSFPQYILDVFSTKKINPMKLFGLNIPHEDVLKGELSTSTKAEIDEQLADSIDENAEHDIKENLEPYFGEVAAADKLMADSVEALLGLYLVDGGISAAFKLSMWFKILPKNDNVENLMNIQLPTPFTEKKLTTAVANFQLDFCLKEIETILGYNFSDPSYLVQALSHSSNIKNNVTECYQRLEFIGDAILDFLITTYIFENCGSLTPGEITDLRSALVNNVTFACIVVRLGLHKHIQTSNTQLDLAILKFVLNQEKREHVVDDAVMYLLEEENCTLSDYVDVPKVLGDVFESLAGAVYFDSGNNLETVWKVFYKFMHNEIAQFSEKVPKQPVRLLYEQIHASPKFLESTVTPNGRVMTPLKILIKGQLKLIHGFGYNKANAKRSAAKVALKMLGITSA